MSASDFYSFPTGLDLTTATTTNTTPSSTTTSGTLIDRQQRSRSVTPTSTPRQTQFGSSTPLEYTDEHSPEFIEHVCKQLSSTLVKTPTASTPQPSNHESPQVRNRELEAENSLAHSKAAIAASVDCTPNNSNTNDSAALWASYPCTPIYMQPNSSNTATDKRDSDKTVISLPQTPLPPPVLEKEESIRLQKWFHKRKHTILSSVIYINSCTLHRLGRHYRPTKSTAVIIKAIIIVIAIYILNLFYSCFNEIEWQVLFGANNFSHPFHWIDSFHSSPLSCFIAFDFPLILLLLESNP